MPHREWRIRIEDILNAIERTKRHINGLSEDQFSKDEKTIDAVIHTFAIIGEAASCVPREIQKKHPTIPWLEMTDMRNFIIHEYFGVSTRVLWKTIHDDLPMAVPLLKELLK
ncbi:MAG: hypothetical protein A2583_04280 [Bdellovibrionales bacterium RIFOXYD1_FULL_53_11]|nr:MAG: hypothetical protein A2583_04280 [Bdellovibrionales bacterium RIFOXYD1_FULL_53_11]